MKGTFTMKLPHKLTDNLWYLGVLDPNLRTFDIIMTTEFGTTYNAYAMRVGSKTVLFETVKDAFWDEYLTNLKKVTDISDIEYLIVSHTEPDHAGSVERLLDLRPDIKIVASSAAIGFLKQIVNRDFVGISIRDGQELTISSGDTEKTLRFFSVPNLHWPDTIYTYIPSEEALVTCDSFGSHYAFSGVLRSAIPEDKVQDYMSAAKYYFDCILGPFKPHMQKAIQKIENLPLKFILPGHGPVLDALIPEFLDVYRSWSSLPEPHIKPKAVIAYVTAYGYTDMLAQKIARGVSDAGDIDVTMFNLTGKGEDEAAAAAGELASADGFLLGTPTILGDALDPIWKLTLTMFPGTHGGKLAGVFGSYGWTGEGVPNITDRLKQLKLNVMDGLRVRFKPGGSELLDAYEYGYDFACKLLKIDNPRQRGVRTLVKCLVCGEIFDSSLDTCPVCGVGRDSFIPYGESDVMEVVTTNQKYVIAGGGIAALSALKEIRKRDKTGHITLISDEEYLPYTRPMLTKSMAAGIDPDQMQVEPAEFYSGADVMLKAKVTAVSADKKTVSISHEGKDTQLSYDRLILATGAECNVPGNIKKIPGVHTIRRIADTDKIHAELKSLPSGSNRAVVIGGGVLGLEAAWELSKLGLNVTVLQSGSALLNKQLDEESSARLRLTAESKKITVLTDVSVEGVEGSTRVSGVKVSAFGKPLGDGGVIPADIVIVSTGVRANTETAKSAGCDIDRAIIVDEHMKTSVADIFAAGDCAEFGGVNLALWSEAAAQGAVAGANAVGFSDVYSPINAAVTFNGFDTSLYAIGDAGKSAGRNYKTVTVSEESGGRYRKLFFLGGKLCGAVSLGSGTDIVKLTADVEKEAKLSEITL